MFLQQAETEGTYIRANCMCARAGDSSLAGERCSICLTLTVLFCFVVHTGYSVFAVVQRDPSGDLALVRTEADEIATAVIASSASQGRSGPGGAGSGSSGHVGVEGFEDEDMELQAALQASLMGGIMYGSASHDDIDVDRRAYPAPVTAASADPIFGPGSGRETPVQRRRGYGVLAQDMDEGEEEEDERRTDLGRGAGASLSAAVDPIAASRARSQAYMEVMRRQQEAALRESYEEEAVGRRRNTRVQEEEDELLRAIEESRRMHEARGELASGDVQDEVPPREAPSTAGFGHDRVYDDEDAELQAALRASLEMAPEGFRLASPPPRVPSPTLPPISHPPPDQVEGLPDDGFETESEAETASVVEEAAPQLSMEEMRRKRLAKFGG